MKVHLYVQNGCERPKDRGSLRSRQVGEHLRYWDGGFSGYYMTAHQDHLYHEADKWWLVLCHGGDSGRWVIRGAFGSEMVLGRDGRDAGRIIASGVRE